MGFQSDVSGLHSWFGLVFTWKYRKKYVSLQKMDGIGCINKNFDGITASLKNQQLEIVIMN